ncbi:DUF2079 domain-containing protein [bacterium]|nr:DUF2079 domain-containing protein [bacterium]
MLFDFYHRHRFLIVAIGATAFVFLLASILRHEMLQSNLFDLGIFDQAVYLISRGAHPYVTTLGFHILGDHAALVLYPIALLYALVPHVYWLFFVQAVALALGALPVFQLARREGLSPEWSKVATLAYLAYPALFNINLFDFHTEVVGLPALLWAVWAGLSRRYLQLAIAVAIVLASKAVMSLTVVMLGVWLFLKRERLAGALVGTAGLTWFYLSSKVVIPMFTGGPPAAVGRYSYLGHSLGEIVWNVFTQPTLVLGRLFGPEALVYYIGLLVPVALAIHWRKATAMVPALAMLLMNVLSDMSAQRDLVHQYSLPIFPFLILWQIQSLKHFELNGTRRWLTPRVLGIWMLISFLAFAKFGYFFSLYTTRLTNLPAAKQAMNLITGPGGVLSESALASHLSQRERVEMINAETEPTEEYLGRYGYVLLDTTNPAWRNSAEYSRTLQQRLETDPRFRRVFNDQGIQLFARIL